MELCLLYASSRPRDSRVPADGDDRLALFDLLLRSQELQELGSELRSSVVRDQEGRFHRFIRSREAEPD